MITFDPNRKAIFEPNSLNLTGNPKKALMIFDDEVWEDYVLKDDSLELLPVKNNRGRLFDTYRMIKHGDENILLVSPNMGGSAAAMDLELLIASGIDTILTFGTCGSMDKNIPKNSIIIPTSAVREEGVSYHYLPPSEEVNQRFESIQVLKDVMTAEDIDFRVGKVWTTDAVYRETYDKLTSMKNLGCICVDMEMASLFAVAEFRKIKFAGFLITDDNIDGPCDIENDRSSENILNMALKIVSNLS